MLLQIGNALPMASIKRFLFTNNMVGRGDYDRGRSQWVIYEIGSKNTWCSVSICWLIIIFSRGRVCQLSRRFFTVLRAYDYITRSSVSETHCCVRRNVC